MIQGYATREATRAHTQKHPMASSILGMTQLTASQAGFGCYRVSVGVAHHETALRKALAEGINLIDSSTNYADGGSESLVGHVLTNLIISEGSMGIIKNAAFIHSSTSGYSLLCYAKASYQMLHIAHSQGMAAASACRRLSKAGDG